MTFGEAIKELKGSMRIRRHGWEKKHIYLEEHFQAIFPMPKPRGDHKRQYATVICEYSDGVHKPGWSPSQEDIFAEDWEVVPYEEGNTY